MSCIYTVAIYAFGSVFAIVHSNTFATIELRASIEAMGQKGAHRRHTAQPDSIGTGEYTYSHALLNSSILKPLPRGWDWAGLLEALDGSVSIAPLPRILSRNLMDACSDLPTKLSFKAAAIHTHQHSLELRFPRGLREMSRRSAQNNLSTEPFRPLHSAHDTRQALFTYVPALPYHAVYCTPKHNNKVSKDYEDWGAAEAYWTLCEKFIRKSRSTTGHLLLPASHPRLLPKSRAGVFSNASFLSADLDYGGRRHLDLVVPYFQATLHLPLTYAVPHPIMLLFFAGADTPHKGLRWKVGEAMKRYAHIAGSGSAGIGIFQLFSSPSEYMPEKTYQQHMQSAAFCLVLKGDTHSSRRLFGAIANGCVPVIISDGILLPFVSFLRWSEFSVSFSEELVVTRVGIITLIGYLQRLVEDGRHALMRGVLPAAAKALLFDDLQDTTTRSVLNPVTLSLADAFLLLVKRCDEAPHTEQCKLVASRESIAKKNAFNK